MTRSASSRATAGSSSPAAASWLRAATRPSSWSPVPLAQLVGERVVRDPRSRRARPRRSRSRRSTASFAFQMPLRWSWCSCVRITRSRCSPVARLDVLDDRRSIGFAADSPGRSSPACSRSRSARRPACRRPCRGKASRKQSPWPVPVHAHGDAVPARRATRRLGRLAASAPVLLQPMQQRERLVASCRLALAQAQRAPAVERVAGSPPASPVRKRRTRSSSSSSAIVPGVRMTRRNAFARRVDEDRAAGAKREVRVDRSASARPGRASASVLLRLVEVAAPPLRDLDDEVGLDRWPRGAPQRGAHRVDLDRSARPGSLR